MIGTNQTTDSLELTHRSMIGQQQEKAKEKEEAEQPKLLPDEYIRQVNSNYTQSNLHIILIFNNNRNNESKKSTIAIKYVFCSSFV